MPNEQVGFFSLIKNTNHSPAWMQGLAVGVEWVSAASFLALAGGFFLPGSSGWPYALGWAGGFFLLAFVLAPALRRWGAEGSVQTLPEFLAARFGGGAVPVLGALCVALCSFLYLVAQLCGVGLVVAYLTGLPFAQSVFVGLVGLLVGLLVSLGLTHLRAVTWMQALQCVLILAAYFVPAVLLSIETTGLPLPQWAHGSVLEKLTQRESLLTQNRTDLVGADKVLAGKEKDVRDIYRQRAADARARLNNLPQSWREGKIAARKKLDDLKSEKAPEAQIQLAQRALDAYPRSEQDARAQWQQELDANLRHAQPANAVAQDPHSNTQQRNFVALLLTLLLGAAVLPHRVARHASLISTAGMRVAVLGPLLCIALIYFTAPALAALAKYHLYTQWVGSSFDQLPAWVTHWSTLDGGRYLAFTDVNNDGVLQWTEISIQPDIVTIVASQVTGYFGVAVGVALGGLVAALAASQSLFLELDRTWAFVLRRVGRTEAGSPQGDDTALTSAQRVRWIALVVIALLAGWAASQTTETLLQVVAAVFSVAAAAFFPTLVAGLYWKRASPWGAFSSMLVGTLVTGYYLAVHQPGLRAMLGLTGSAELWWGITPAAAGIFGVVAGAVVLVGVSLLTRASSRNAATARP